MDTKNLCDCTKQYDERNKRDDTHFDYYCCPKKEGGCESLNPIANHLLCNCLQRARLIQVVPMGFVATVLQAAQFRDSSDMNNLSLGEIIQWWWPSCRTRFELGEPVGHYSMCNLEMRRHSLDLRLDIRDAMCLSQSAYILLLIPDNYYVTLVVQWIPFLDLLFCCRDHLLYA